MSKFLILFSIMLIFFRTSSAQEYRVSITPEYAMPIGKLKWTYKNSVGATATFALVDHHKRKKITRYSGISIGYLSMKPLKDTLYYVVDKGVGNGGAGVGRAVFTAFNMITLRLSTDWEFPLTKNLYATAGIAAGILQGIRTISYTDDFGGSNSSSENVPWVSLTPRAGFTYRLNKNISVSPLFSYTALLEMGSQDAGDYDYNPDSGSFNHFISASVSLHYSF